jgi:NADH-quinone oxidoreductase subunit C
MSEPASAFGARLRARFPEAAIEIAEPRGEVTIEVGATVWHGTCRALRDEFGFEQLMDLSGVDYLGYGTDEWDTDVSSEGFSRGVEGKGPGRFAWGQRPSAESDAGEIPWQTPQRRFAAVVHLLSLQHNQRVRVRCFAENDDLPVVASVTDLWAGANWFEREAFDLYGIIFEGHPDLRRILTDYGFVGHPFRKDFPLIGNVEVRYDAEKQRVVYEPVTSVEPRVLVPRVIRDDARYKTAAGEGVDLKPAGSGRALRSLPTSSPDIGKPTANPTEVKS